jgi:hypothetical protein
MKYLNRGGISNTLISLLAGNRGAAGIAVEDRIGTVLHGKKVGKVFHTEELSFRLVGRGDELMGSVTGCRNFNPTSV